jgi:putative addiction module killer protein
VYYTRQGNELVILLCGSDKSTQDETIKAAKKIAENLEGI